MRPPGLAPGEATVASYGAFLTRHRHALVAGVLVGVLAALLLVAVGPKTFASRANILVLGLFDGNRTQARSVSVNLDTEAQLVTSEAVLRDAASRVGPGTDLEEMDAAVEVTVPPNSTLLSITYRASDAVIAQRGAAAVAGAYLDRRLSQAEDELSAHISSVERQRDEIRELLVEVVARIGTPEELPADRGTRAALADRLRVLGQDAAAAAATTPLGGRMIAEAPLPTRPQSPVAVLVLASCALAGLLTAIGAAALRDRFAPRVSAAAEISDRWGVPVLSLVRSGPPRERDLLRLGTLVIVECGAGPEPVRSLQVAATTPSTRALATDLAEVLRGSGRAVTLLRPPGDASDAGVDAEHERSTALSQEVSAAIGRGELVLVDVDTGSAAPLRTDALLVVVELGRTRRADLDRLVDLLHREHPRITGVVAVEPVRTPLRRWAGPAGTDRPGSRPAQDSSTPAPASVVAVGRGDS